MSFTRKLRLIPLLAALALFLAACGAETAAVAPASNADDVTYDRRRGTFWTTRQPTKTTRQPTKRCSPLANRLMPLMLIR